MCTHFVPRRAAIFRDVSQSSKSPASFEDKIFFVTSSRKFLWFDEETGEHKVTETNRNETKLSTGRLRKIAVFGRWGEILKILYTRLGVV